MVPHKLDFELDTAFHPFNRLRSDRWLHGVEVETSLDYLATRPDIDTTRFAYYGVSWGGYLGGLMPAVEPRIRTVLLYVAGLENQRGQPEVDVDPRRR